MANLQIQPAVKPSAKLIHITRLYLSTFSTRGSDLFFFNYLQIVSVICIHDQSYLTYIVQSDKKINHCNEYRIPRRKYYVYN